MSPGKSISSKRPKRPLPTPPEEVITLDEVMIAFQKSLSRSRQSAETFARSEIEFLAGTKSLFVVEALDLELNVGVDTAGSKGNTPDYVRLNFDAPPENRSKIRFRVAEVPIEPATRGALTLTLQDSEFPSYEIAALLVRPARNTESSSPIMPAGGQNIAVHIVVNGEWVERFPIRTKAKGNNAGHAKFTINFNLDGIEIKSERKLYSILPFPAAPGTVLSVYAIAFDPVVTSNVIEIEVPKASGDAS